MRATFIWIRVLTAVLVLGIGACTPEGPGPSLALDAIPAVDAPQRPDPVTADLAEPDTVPGDPGGPDEITDDAAVPDTVAGDSAVDAVGSDAALPDAIAGDSAGPDAVPEDAAVQDTPASSDAPPEACTGPGCVDPKVSVIEIDPAATVVEIDGSLPLSYTITVRNAGSGRVLTVPQIVLDYTPQTDAERASGAAFTLDAPGLPAVISPAGEGGYLSYAFKVHFRPSGDAMTRTAVVTIRNDNSQNVAAQSLEIRFQTRPCAPSLEAPARVDFGLVALDAAAETEELLLANTGSCPLVIDWLVMQGPANFTLDLPDGRSFQAVDPGLAIVLDPPVTIEGNSAVAWSATFRSADCGPATALVTLHSNESGAIDGRRRIELIGNSPGPRLEVLPQQVEFGGKRIGQPASVNVELRSLGTVAVVVTGISLKTPDSSLDFGIDYSSLPGGVAPTPAAPLVIPVNQSVEFRATFVPDARNPQDESGNPVLDTGAIVILTNTCEGKPEVALSGYGREADCPQPVIVIEEGENAQPQDLIHLHGEQSQAAEGTITRYTWRITEQPGDNRFVLVPAANYPSPTHEVNVAGQYEYCLDVCDSGNVCSDDPQCRTTACKRVDVVPEEAIHCELTWSTPGDPDQFDSGPGAGADLDLHFLHPFATGQDVDGDTRPDGWFDIPYDVFWYNRNPEWESINPNVADNPTLDRDDTDGAGPENLNLQVPGNNRVYRIGVHYWDDHGFGYSFPRLKCYVWGQMVFDRDLASAGGGRPLSRCDMWEAATIQWPEGRVAAVANADGSLKIIPDYMNDAFATAGGNDCGQ